MRVAPTSLWGPLEQLIEKHFIQIGSPSGTAWRLSAGSKRPKGRLRRLSVYEAVDVGRSRFYLLSRMLRRSRV